MSFLRNNFSTKKAPPRKPVRHRNPLNLTGPEIEAELGENFHGVNLKIGDKKIGYNSEQAKWELRALDGMKSAHTQNTTQKIRKEIETLKDENNMLKLKVEILLNLVAESVAELNSS